MKIDTITAKQILDSRGRPTLETTLTSGTVSGSASVPSGKSTGTHEACELRDTDDSVHTAITHVECVIAEALCGRDFASLDELDAALIALDGTQTKSRLGANALLSVSIAATRLAANLSGVPLWRVIADRAGTTPAAPHLYVNVMNGGVHADFRLPFQEYILVVPGSPNEALALAHGAFTKLGEKLGDVPMGDEGGYAPSFTAIDEPFELLDEIITEFPSMSIAIDAAASEFYQDGAYQFLGATHSASELTELYARLATQFPFHSIEDPFDEECGEDFARLTDRIGDTVLIVGDDLTVTTPARIRAAFSGREITTVLIKPNQIGTVREALEAVTTTYSLGGTVVASHRSGETSDTFIADFAYGVGAHGIKAGGLGQRERLLKYERLVEIEREAEEV